MTDTTDQFQPLRDALDGKPLPAMTDQQAALLNQAHDMLLAHADAQRALGNDSAANGAECSADAVLQMAAAWSAAPALLAEVERLRDTLQFVERWANHHATKPHMTPQEALSTIQHHPHVKAITLGYADGKAPDTPDPWAEVERLRERERRCETMDLAEKVALLRGLQEIGVRLGIYDPTPADVVAEVERLRAMVTEMHEAAEATAATYAPLTANVERLTAELAAARVDAERWMEGVNIERLSRALTKMGCAHEASQEAIAASLADHVNALTRAIQASDMTDAAIRASCATTVFLTALEAQADDADDLGVQGWLDLAEERIRKWV